jgi:oxygen-independent coproporphyrinogen III oxidase
MKPLDAVGGPFGPPLATYVHIPFCVRKCAYCDFVSFAGQPAAMHQRYGAALRREIGLAAAAAGAAEYPHAASGQPPLASVFFGGGTPTLLDGELLAGILDGIRDGFGLSPDCEVTLEANPGTVTADQLAACHRAGFNRISLGLQASQARLLRLLGRIHSYEDFLESVALAHQAGFKSINADILFGLPGQTLADVAETTRLILRLPIDHVSFYSLMLEEGTPMYDRYAEAPEDLPDEDLEREQYHLISRLLREEGFDHYEISNAARPGRRCRHNLTYWQGLPYYGFGVAAHSYRHGVRCANTTDLATYLAAFETPDNPNGAGAAARELEVIDVSAARKEMVLLGLRLLDGVSAQAFSDRFGCRLEDVFAAEIDRLAGRRLLIHDAAGIRLSPLGLDLANQAFQEFV